MAFHQYGYTIHLLAMHIYQVVLIQPQNLLTAIVSGGDLGWTARLFFEDQWLLYT
jgi:hypothetical protein